MRSTAREIGKHFPQPLDVLREHAAAASNHRGASPGPRLHLEGIRIRGERGVVLVRVVLNGVVAAGSWLLLLDRGLVADD